MDINLIYMILGVIATILVGYWGIKYTANHKTITNLLFFENGCISLFKTVVKDLDEVEIKYKGKKIDENLLIYKGTFFNSGTTDIDKSIIHQPLKVSLPENYEWKKIIIIDQSKDVNITLDYNESEATFNWDILKENEYFTFDSVIEYKPQPNPEENENSVIRDITRYLTRNIDFSHRITNLKSIEKEDLPTKPAGRFEFTFFSIYLLAIVCLGLYWSAGQFVYPDYNVSYEVKMDSTKIYSSIEAHNKNEIKLLDDEGSEIVKKINASKEIGLTGKIKTVKEDLSYWGVIGGGLLALLMLFVFILMVYSHFKDKALYKKVKSIADKYDDKTFPRRRSSRILFPFD
jgi:hypothetical protein